MDALTHVFLPLTVAYVLRHELFASPNHLLLAGFGLLSDFDKFLGMPGLLHSLVTLVPISLGILAVERWYRGEFLLAPLVVAFIASHLVLDFIDGGPVPLLFPFVEPGIGLQYPARTVFGAAPLGVAVEGPIAAIRVATPRPGFNAYGLVKGAGIASLLAFVMIYTGWDPRSG